MNLPWLFPIAYVIVGVVGYYNSRDIIGDFPNFEAVGTWVGGFIVLSGVVVAVQQLRSYKTSADTRLSFDIFKSVTTDAIPTQRLMMQIRPFPKNLEELAFWPITAKQKSILTDGILTLLSSYEHIGLLVKTGRIDAALILDFIGLQFLNDFNRLEGYITQAQVINKGYFENIAYLETLAKKHKEQRRWGEFTNASEALLKQFSEVSNTKIILTAADLEYGDKSDSMMLAVKTFLCSALDAVYIDERTTEKGWVFSVGSKEIIFSRDLMRSFGSDSTQIPRILADYKIAERVNQPHITQLEL